MFCHRQSGHSVVAAMSATTREQLIERCRRHMMQASTPEKARYWLAHMTRLVASRPPAAVVEMERARGLR